MKKVLDFWMKIWLYVMAIGGGILIVLLIISWNQLDWVTRLVYFTVIILPFHVWEEWRFPAGFHYIYNLRKKSDIPDRYPMNRVSDMITNFGALIVFIIFITIGGIPIITLTLFYFCVIEVIAHTFIGIFAYNSFKDKGKKTIYNPGLGTTYLMFLPTAIGYIIILATGIFPTVWSDWLLGAVLGVGQIILLIILPEGLLKNRNTSYPFTGKYQYGYFKKFID
jgi:hypothetical protein